MRWRAFSAHLVDLAEALGVQVVVSLGALLGDVPAHAPGGDERPRLRRRAARAPRHAEPRATRARPGSSASCTRPAPAPGCPSASLWAAVPHYVAAAANPKAALALLRRRGRPDRRLGRRLRARVGAPPTTSARSGSRCRATPTSRRSSNASSRPPTARSESSPEDVPSGDIARARIPALPAPARARGKCRASRASRAVRAAATSPRPGRRCGSRRSSRPRARASARTPARGCPRRPRAPISFTASASPSPRRARAP